MKKHSDLVKILEAGLRDVIINWSLMKDFTMTVTIKDAANDKYLRFVGMEV